VSMLVGQMALADCRRFAGGGFSLTFAGSSPRLTLDDRSLLDDGSRANSLVSPCSLSLALFSS